MEQIPLLGKFLQCPEEDSILKDLEQESYSDQTIVGGYQWKELRNLLWNDAHFNRKEFIDYLS